VTADYSYLDLVGCPVLPAGTAFSDARKELSDMAASALMPARMNSLFLTEFDNFPARCLRSSSRVYSPFGMVKLSRTNFGFLTLDAFSAVGLATALTFTLFGAFAAAFFAEDLTRALVAAVLTGAVSTALNDEARGFITRLVDAGVASRTGAVVILDITGVAVAVLAVTSLAGVVLFFFVAMCKPS